MATQEQIETIENRRFDDTARDMQQNGVRLTWDQVQEIGDSGVHWLRSRLELIPTMDDDGITFEYIIEGVF